MDFLHVEMSNLYAGLFFSIAPYIDNKFSLNNQPETVYHYTDLNGLIGIFENDTFWASNIRFLNDREEYTDGEIKCNKIIDKLLPQQAGIKQLYLERLKKSLLEKQSKGIDRISKDVYALSFSCRKDALSLWRGYGNSCGIAIEFDLHLSNYELPGLAFVREEQYEEDVKKFTSPNEAVPRHERRFFVQKVIYDDSAKIDVINEIINMGLNFLNTKHFDDDQDITAAVEAISSAVFYYLPQMKDGSFIDEQEYRFIFDFVNNTKDGVPDKICFRQRNGVILPYRRLKVLDLNCRPIRKWPINSIIVGPGPRQHDTAESIQYFLSHRGHEDLASKVILSKVPYRE